MTTTVSFDLASSSTLPYLCSQPPMIRLLISCRCYNIAFLPVFLPPADEYVEKGLDLNTYLVRNKVATYFKRDTSEKAE